MPAASVRSVGFRLLTLVTRDTPARHRRLAEPGVAFEAMAARTPALVLAGWTLFIWATRIRNTFTDDDLDGGALAIALVTSIAFTALALAVLVAAWRRQHLTLAVRVLAAVSIVYWPVRAVQIALADHDLGFVLVHAALGVVSVVLSVWAWTGRLRRVGTPRAAGVLSGR